MENRPDALTYFFTLLGSIGQKPRPRASTYKRENGGYWYDKGYDDEEDWVWVNFKYYIYVIQEADKRFVITVDTADEKNPKFPLGEWVEIFTCLDGVSGTRSLVYEVAEKYRKKGIVRLDLDWFNEQFDEQEIYS